MSRTRFFCFFTYSISNRCLTFACENKWRNRSLHRPNRFSEHINFSISMKKNEEYTENRSRDWLIFGVSTVAVIALLLFKPEWVWVAWPFQFTALAGALGRL